MLYYKTPLGMQEPVPHVIAKPDPSNILEWHFVIDGQEGTPYHGGTYHGKLLFPADYPFKPPGILFITPSGRFKPYTKICFSFSDYHPECWNPIWHVGTILIATVSFMNEESSTTGESAISAPACYSPCSNYHADLFEFHGHSYAILCSSYLLMPPTLHHGARSCKLCFTFGIDHCHKP